MDQGEDHINEKDRSIFILMSLHVILLSILIKKYIKYYI
jgi:membrane protein involved in colicin uptake